MFIANEERKSQGPLIVFIDLLFLLVAFFVLLLYFIQGHKDISEQALEAMQENLSRITGEELNVPEALQKLETVVGRFMADQERVMAQEREIARKRQRRERRETFTLEYSVDRLGGIVYEGRVYSPGEFLAQVVEPMRKTHWVAFRAYADPDTPFGKIIEGRRTLLRDSNEFDTYWDNVTRPQEKRAAKPSP